jgi:hypothetical protein
VRAWRHCSKVARHHVGYLLNISDARAPTGHNAHEKTLVKSQQYNSMIDMNKGVDWLGVNERQVLFRKVKQNWIQTRICF